MIFFTQKLRMLLDWTPSHIILPLHLADLMAAIFCHVCAYILLNRSNTLSKHFSSEI